jgi:hypothetical protein
MEIKFLGLTIDDTLSCKQHTEQAINKMCSACYALRNIKHIEPIDILTVIYFAPIHSIISYGIIFGSSSYCAAGVCTPKEYYQNYNKHYTKRFMQKNLQEYGNNDIIFPVHIFISLIQN